MRFRPLSVCAFLLLLRLRVSAEKLVITSTPPAAGTRMQTDAPINPGNSGSSLLNMYGEVVGISTLKLVKKNISGIGFALSATDIMAVPFFAIFILTRSSPRRRNPLQCRRTIPQKRRS